MPDRYVITTITATLVRGTTIPKAICITTIKVTLRHDYCVADAPGHRAAPRLRGTGTARNTGLIPKRPARDCGVDQAPSRHAPRCGDKKHLASFSRLHRTISWAAPSPLRCFTPRSRTKGYTRQAAIRPNKPHRAGIIGQRQIAIGDLQLKIGPQAEIASTCRKAGENRWPERRSCGQLPTARGGRGNTLADLAGTIPAVRRLGIR
jgi:hypothetical protein